MRWGRAASEPASDAASATSATSTAMCGAGRGGSWRRSWRHPFRGAARVRHGRRRGRRRRGLLALALQAFELARDPARARVNRGQEGPAAVAAVLARQRSGQLFQAVQFDPDGIVAETRQHVLAQQIDSARRHREDRKQDGSKQAVTDRDLQGMRQK